MNDVLKHTGYDLMPAAVDFFHTYETLGVKFEKNDRKLWMTKKIIDGIHIFYYPDRTIYRTKPGVNNACIPAVAMDQYLDYSVLSNPKLYSDMAIATS